MLKYAMILSFLYPSRRTIRGMPKVMQEACQFHSLAVKRDFLGFGALRTSENCSIMVKFPNDGKFVRAMWAFLDLQADGGNCSFLQTAKSPRTTAT